MRFKTTVIATGLIASSALCHNLVAQEGDPEYATDYIIVKVHPGVAPQPVEGIGMSLRYVEPTDLPPDEVAVNEVLMAALIQVWDVASIEPMIRFPIANADLAAQTGVDRLYTVTVPEGTDVATMVDQFAPFETHLEFASVAWYGHFAGLPPDDPLLSDQWYLNNTGQSLITPCPPPPGSCACGEGNPPGTVDADIDALEAWTLETGSSSIVVAVLDSGADLDHPDLINKLVPGHNFADGDPDDPSENDGIGHGTMVSGVVAAEADNAEGIAGVSWGSLIMPLRIGVLGPVDVATAANALAFAADAEEPNVDVVNMSWGGAEAKWEPILGPIVQFAHIEGLVLVASAGNTGTSPIKYPASDPLVIGVTATDSDDNLLCFSSFGDALGQVSVAAPGLDIVTTFWPEALFPCPGELYCRTAGTSFAAPQVAGLAALILSADSTLTNVEVKQIIEDTADDLGEIGEDVFFGHGRINAYVAVCTARSMLCRGDTNGDCIVGVLDLLTLLGGWGPNAGPGDLNCDFGVGVLDLLALLASWGKCPCAGPGPEPPSLEEELTEACLTMEDWFDFVDVMQTGSEAEKENWLCWMEHYLNNCNRCTCTHSGVICPGPDPFS